MVSTAFTPPRIASREEWLVARKALLEKEKALTRARDALNAERRQLPIVPIEKAYELDGPHGAVSLLELFEGRPQLIIYHFMFGPDDAMGCSMCSLLGDSFGHLEHLHQRATTFALVSRAPLSKIQPFKERMGWTMPWYSSFGSDFNYDFHATADESVAPVEYNYRSKAELDALGHGYHVKGEQPVLTVFLRDGDTVYHTYSAFARGMESIIPTYALLDMTAFGRGEGWDGMPDLNGQGGHWVRHRHRYDAPPGCGCG